MISDFPNFKKLELNDKTDVETITKKYLPYSDFSFISMWSWNLIDEIVISRLHTNLIVRFTDYITNQPFYSFIGNENVNDTADKLLKFSIKSGLSPFLRLVPEVSIQEINRDRFEVSEDRNHFDYVYSIDELHNYPGGKFSKKRNHVNGFLQKFPQAVGKIIDLRNKKTAENVLGLFDKWHSLKIKKDADSDLHDLAAMKRLLFGVEIFDFITVGIFVEENLVAIFINELIDSTYVLAHMMKADVSVDDGLYSFLMKKNAEILSSFNMKLFNYEQDLGIENLRIAKTRFRPQTFLKKYVVGYIHNTNPPTY